MRGLGGGVPFRSLYFLSGAGNDFLAAPGPAPAPSPELLQRLCQRGTGLGADGFFLLERLDRSTARMHHWNPDGTRAALCANGTRCAVRLAGELGWIAPGESLRLETDSGVVLGDLGTGPGETRVRFPWAVERPRKLALEEQVGWYVQVGVPHLVVLTADPVEGAPVSSQGPLLRRHPSLGPAGANVSWVRILDAGGFEIRTFERGVEAETLACGSAVLAAFHLGQTLTLLGEEATARVAGGFPLRARRVSGPAGSAFELEGDARLLARLELLPDLAIPIQRPPAARQAGPGQAREAAGQGEEPRLEPPFGSDVEPARRRGE